MNVFDYTRNVFSLNMRMNEPKRNRDVVVLNKQNDKMFSICQTILVSLVPPKNFFALSLLRWSPLLHSSSPLSHTHTMGLVTLAVTDLFEYKYVHF